MNILQLETGGRPVANDDFQVLQERGAVLGLPALLADLGPCVVSGCRVWQTGSQYNVGAGMVWDGTQLLDFPGRSNVALPAMFAPGAVQVVDERAYQTGGTKTTIKGQSMDLVLVVAGAGNLVMNAWGCLRWNDVVRASVRYLGEIQPLGAAGYAAADYDADGVGLPGTSAWGWALCDGRNGRESAGGRFMVGLDANRAAYDTVGKTGGLEEVTLLITQMPAHTHKSAVSNPGPARLGNTIGKADNTYGGTADFSATSTGGSQAHENRPPFITVLLRQWVGY